MQDWIQMSLIFDIGFDRGSLRMQASDVVIILENGDQREIFEYTQNNIYEVWY